MVASKAESTMETSAMAPSFSTWSAVKDPENPCKFISKECFCWSVHKTNLKSAVVVGAEDRLVLNSNVELGQNRGNIGAGRENDVVGGGIPLQ